MMFITKEDQSPPSMEECLRRAGLPPQVSHRAIDDARQVIALIRKGLGVA